MRAEDAGEPALPVLVDHDAMQGHATAPGFADGHPAVLDPVLALVVVKVVGLAIGQHHEELSAGGFLGQLRRDMADRGAKAGVMPRFQPADAVDHRTAHRLVKCLATVQEHPISPHRGKAPDAKPVAQPIDPARHGGKGLSRNLDHRGVAHRRLGAARAVDQEGDGKVTLDLAGGDVDAVAALPGGAAVDLG